MKIGHKPDFWHLQTAESATQIACTDGQGRTATYAALTERVNEVSKELSARGPRQLGFIYSTNSPEWLCVYLACLRVGHVPLLLPADLESSLADQLINSYGPQWLWKPFGPQTQDEAGRVSTDSILACFTWRESSTVATLHPDLALLLSTSGSTGSPKLVKLSYRALASNANSIADYLDIQAQDRAMTTLPPNYSFGLSVINSHLAVGARLVMNNTSLMSRDFLRVVQQEKVTSLAGVPTWYQMLLRTGFDKAGVHSLRVLTQAGGRLDERTKQAVLNFANAKGLRFYVMYGQTEAAPRISYVPPEVLGSKLNSIGIPIPGGNLQLDAETSELIYSGPNVMMGYAETQSDLAKGDELNGVLRTGDIGAVDEDGYFSITGRLKRFVKLSGNRYGLDEIEEQLIHMTKSNIAVAGRDERLGIWIEGDDQHLQALAKAFLQEKYGLHHTLFRIHFMQTLPLLPTGKKDYAGLVSQLG
jgi:acyl-CoA synthetase (AMP-forming)/AMP-acid ligase II